ncbi:MAG: SRPBCC family protein [Polyangiaceae bacterium]
MRQSWVVAAHHTELERPGAFVTVELGGDRVIVTRNRELGLSAFLDGCPHRGVPLVPLAGCEEGPVTSGCLEGLELRCPYHGLALDLEGRPTRVPEWMRLTRPALEPVGVAERYGFVFVSIEPRESFSRAVGAGVPWLERASMHALRLGRRTTYEVSANWKLMVENFQESQHFGPVHPSLEARTPWRRSTSVDLGGALLGGTMELEPGFDTVSEDGALHGRAFVAAEEDRRRIGDALFFPVWLTSLQPDYFLSYRLVPRDVARTAVLAEIFFHAECGLSDGAPARRSAADVFAFWDRTNGEDRAICEAQQRGLGFASARPARLGPAEDGVANFVAKVAAAYRKRRGG